MLTAIDTARVQILLEMYLMSSGATASRFVAALGAAARRGVAVHVLLDDFGTQALSRPDRDRLQDAGVHLALYNPLGLRRWRWVLLRDHRKLLLVDGRVAFVGGMGITDEFDPASRSDGSDWHDVMLALQGPCVADWQQVFVRVWTRWSAQPIAPPVTPPVTSRITPLMAQPITLAMAPPGHPAPTPTDRLDGRVLAQTRTGGQAVMRAVLAEIGKARKRVWIATAYFAPTRRLRRALKRAARRGVDVRLLLAGPNTDHPGVWHAGRRYYGRLLRSGVRIFEYQPRFLHAKMVLCDDWASIGSSNLDHWNLRWSLDANQAVMDPRFAEQLAELFTHDFAQSTSWTASDWQQRGRWARLLEGLAGTLDDYLVQWSYRRALRHPQQDETGTAASFGRKFEP